MKDGDRLMRLPGVKSHRCRESAERLRIGLTFDLRSSYLARGYAEEETAEFDSQATVDSIARALNFRGHHTVLIGNVFELMRRLLEGERWDMVFNIAEGLHGFGRESQIPSLLDNYRIPYTFSDPCVLAICLHKGFAKRILRDSGLPTPPFLEIHGEEDLANVDLHYPLFVKPVAEGTAKGVGPDSLISNSRELYRRSLDLLGRFKQPVLVEEYLPGRELTVGILGTGRRARALGALEVIIRPMGDQGVYSYRNKERCEDLVEYVLATDRDSDAAQDVAVEAWRALGCRDGGRVDIRFDRYGCPNIMELNPLAGLHPTHSDLPMLAEKVGMPYEELIHRIVCSVRERMAFGGVGDRVSLTTRCAGYTLNAAKASE